MERLTLEQIEAPCAADRPAVYQRLSLGRGDGKPPPLFRS